MKNKIILAVSVLTLTTLAFGQQEKKQEVPVLVSAYGTSYSADSSNAVCVLDPACKGYWQPQAQDSGSNEGIYFKFDKALDLNRIEIKFEGDLVGKVSISPFLDASNTEQQACAFEEARSYNTHDCHCYDKNGKDVDSIRLYEYDTRLKEEGIYCVKPVTVSMADAKKEGADTRLTLPESDGKWKPFLQNSHTTFFFKITKNEAAVAPKIKEVTFIGKDDKPIEIQLPKVVKSEVKATSTLSPEFAYDAANLFDQRLEMAWSTEGKNTSGISEKIDITFDTKQEITGIQVWNGYQRSDVHYKANARVKQLDINGQTITLKDKQGQQDIALPQPIKSKHITLEIKNIYKGTKYKDVLLSELKFIGKNGQIILPQVQMPTVKKGNILLQPDTSYSNVFYASVDGFCSTTSLRLRDNSNFVIYDHEQSLQDDVRKEYTGIFEGNWEPIADNKVRLFGKKYVIQATYENYNREDTSLRNSVVAIFQSPLEMKQFTDLSNKEKEDVVSFFVELLPKDEYCDTECYNYNEQTKEYEEAENGAICEPGDCYYGSLNVRNLDKTVVRVDGKTFDDLVKKLIPVLEKINPIYVKSDVYVDLLVPSDKVKLCE